jgi:hypothetical protein
LKKTRCILGKFIDIASIKVNEGWIGSYHKLVLARGPVMHKIIMVSYFPCKYRTFKYSFLQRFTKYWWIGTCRIGSYGPVNHCQWFSNIKCKQTEITQVYEVKTASELKELRSKTTLLLTFNVLCGHQEQWFNVKCTTSVDWLMD